MPETIQDLRKELLQILDSGGLSPFQEMGISTEDLRDAIEEFILIYELQSKPSASQSIMAKILICVIEARNQNG